MGNELWSQIGLLLTACLAPSLFFLGYLHFRTGQRGIEGRRLGLLVFAVGLLAGPIALALFNALENVPFYAQLAAIDSAAEGERFTYAMFATGPIEELAKFVVAWSVLKLFKPRGKSLLIGPFVAGAAALGFATIENWMFMIEVGAVEWSRAIVLPFNHLLFSSFWGVGLAVSFAGRRQTDGSRWIVAGLMLSFVYHGLYDYIIFSEQIPAYWSVVLVGSLWVWLVAAITRLHRMNAQTA